MPGRRVLNSHPCSGRARPALPLPAARGRGRNRRRRGGGRALKKGQPVCKGGGGAAPLPARLRPASKPGAQPRCPDAAARPPLRAPGPALAPHLLAG